MESVPPITPPTLPAPTVGWTKTVFRLLCLRNGYPAPNEPRFGTLALLSLIALGTWIGVDWYNHRPDAILVTYNLGSLSWYALMILAIAAVMARFASPPLRFGRVLIALLAVTPVIIAAIFLAQNYLDRSWMLWATLLAGLAYIALYLRNSLRTLSGSPQRGASALGLLLVAACIWFTPQLYINPSVWSAQEEDQSNYNETWDQGENLLFWQQRRIDDAVAKIAPSDASAPNAFFLGFAGYAEERVFAEEIKLAAHTLAERYGATSRSLLLVNDRRDLDALPLASPTALKYALKVMAGKMNLDKDILFLSISSHGSEDGAISVSHGALMLHDLSADDLADALNDAGIKQRVIVVSACYSGAFVEPLSTPSTIILTASASDRTSFGCSDTRELTYFGEAFYRDALPGAASLREAFERSKREIEAREKDEGVEPSQPQAFFGAQLEPKVNALLKPSA